MNRKTKKALLLATKIGGGTAVAITMADWLELSSPTSAGTITLLTLLTTKRNTIKLSMQRLLTFAMTTGLAFILFKLIPNVWIAFGMLIFSQVFILEMFKSTWTLSVNAMIAIHYLVEQNFTFEFILNEFCLLMIGIVMANLINVIQTYSADELSLYKEMHYCERRIRELLREIVVYIKNPEISSPVWGELSELEQKIHQFMVHAVEYQENTFVEHPRYFIDYFEMREFQCEVLHMLHYEIRKIRNMPLQAHIVSDYIEYLIPYVDTHTHPQPQLEKLQLLLENLSSQSLPKNREEFESRAILYHILMDLEDFILRKKNFLEALSDEQKMMYDHIE